MFNTRRKALLVSIALVGAAGFLTACQNSDDSTATGAAQGSSSTAPAGNGAASSSPSAGGGDQGTSTGSGGGAVTGSNGQGGGGQTCGANDVSLTTKTMSQAGGYILITAKAKPGITCFMPGEDPFVSFGTDIVAHPVEQAVGKPIKLSGSAAAYAGLNAKSTKSNGGSQWNSITVGTAEGDPNATDVPLGTTVTADKPLVTNWHSIPQDAVPLG
jgi:hypothetical protein